MGIPGVRIRGRSGHLRLRVSDVRQLAVTTVTEVGTTHVTHLELTVDSWNPPKGWVGDPRSPGLTEVSVASEGAGARLEMRWRAPVDIGLGLAAAIRCLRPEAGIGRGPSLTLTPGLSAAAADLAGAVHDVLDPAADVHRHLRRSDTLVVSEPMGYPAIERVSTLVIEQEQWTVDGADHQVWVDPMVHRPLGRSSTTERITIRAEVTARALHLTGPGFDRRVTGDLTEADVAALTAISGIDATMPLGPRWEAQLQACGVVLNPGVMGDELAWQVASVAARRAALRTQTWHAALGRWPSVTAIVLTHRETYLDQVAEQVSHLDYPQLEVVIACHGLELSEQKQAAMNDIAGRPLRFITIEGSVAFGAAMQQACNQAEGELITKIDDDDYYGPEHVWDLVLARMYSGAQIIGKALDWIVVESEECTVFRPTYESEKYALFVAGGTLLISTSDLDQVGGWRPVSRSIDRALLERVQQAGGLVYRTHGLGYLYVRHRGPHTAQVEDSHFLTKTKGVWPGLLRHLEFGTTLAS